MRQLSWMLLGAVLLRVGGAEAAPSKAKPSDAQVRKILIDESRAGYSGNCPCPYDRDSRGRSCGRRSAYSRAGGEEVLCFDRDVTKEMIDAYRKRGSEGEQGEVPAAEQRHLLTLVRGQLSPLLPRVSLNQTA